MPITSQMRPPLFHQGLTLVETLMTVAVVSILVAVSVPSIGIVYDRYRTRQEERMQLEIYEALLRFADDYNKLPEDNSSNPMCGGAQQWYNCLEAELDYSAEQIQFDVWGSERRYVARSRTKTIVGESFPVYYASIHSRGPNLQAGATTTGIATHGTNFAAANNSAWWANRSQAQAMSWFETLAPAEDDVLIKVTDSVQKSNKLAETQKRLQAVSKALYDFEQSKYVMDLLSATAGVSVTVDQWIHTFPAQQSSPDNLGTQYGKAVLAATNGIFSGGRRVENRDLNSTNKRNRLRDMVTMMRIIGLPDGYCCSALDIQENAVATTDYTQRRPFFYYANPRRLIGGVCGARATQIPYAPYIVRRTERKDGGGAVCN